MHRFTWPVVAVAVTMAVALSVGVASASGGNSANAKLCQQGGWMNLVRTEDGSGFNDQGECVSHAAEGGNLSQAQAPPSVSVSYTPNVDPRFCNVTVNLAYFAANTLYSLSVTVRNPIHGDFSFSGFEVTTGNSGAGSVGLFSLRKIDPEFGEPNSIGVTADGVSSGFQQVIC